MRMRGPVAYVWLLMPRGACSSTAVRCRLCGMSNCLPPCRLKSNETPYCMCKLTQCCVLPKCCVLRGVCECGAVSSMQLNCLLKQYCNTCPFLKVYQHASDLRDLGAHQEKLLRSAIEFRVWFIAALKCKLAVNCTK
jgi:hypothetical protein